MDRGNHHPWGSFCRSAVDFPGDVPLGLSYTPALFMLFLSFALLLSFALFLSPSLEAPLASSSSGRTRVRQSSVFCQSLRSRRQTLSLLLSKIIPLRAPIIRITPVVVAIALNVAISIGPSGNAIRWKTVQVRLSTRGHIHRRQDSRRHQNDQNVLHCYLPSASSIKQRKTRWFDVRVLR